MTPDEFHQWLLAAETEEITTYYKGFLMIDRENNPELHELGALVWNAYEGGFITLRQKREGEGRYTYIARRTEEIVG